MQGEIERSAEEANGEQREEEKERGGGISAQPTDANPLQKREPYLR